jgi:hypothetical protein
MHVRFLCNWPPYRDGQCLEILDRVGADFVARCMAEVVTAADVRSYATIDRVIDERINKQMPARGGRRVIREDQWRAELGQKGPAPFRHVPATLTARG